MNNDHTLGPTADTRARMSVICTRTSVVILCGTVLLVAGMYLTVAWLEHNNPAAPAPPQAAVAFLAWLALPPIGVLFAIPGMRSPRRRAALVALIGNTILWAALPVSIITVTLISGP